MIESGINKTRSGLTDQAEKLGNMGLSNISGESNIIKVVDFIVKIQFSLSIFDTIP